MSEKRTGKGKGRGNGGTGGGAAGGAPGPRAKAGSGSPMDVGLLEQMVKLMAANDLNTVDVREGDKRVILKRGPAASPYPPAPYAPPVAAPTPAAPPAAQAGSGSGAPAASEDAGLVAIKSPMVGTFYAAAKPGDKPFAPVGTAVHEETDVCIIEAMKTFNVHKAGVSGTIARVLVQDGQTVQFDQALFLVKPA